MKTRFNILLIALSLLLYGCPSGSDSFNPGFELPKNDTVKKPSKPKPDKPEKPNKPKDTIGEVYEIELIENDTIDQTLSLQAQIDAIPNGNPEKWNVIEFPEGSFWTEGVNIGRNNKGIIDFHDRHYLIIKGGTLYTKRPGIDHVGHVGGNDYSHRRHILIQNSSNLVFIELKIEGSNKVIGAKVGMSEEHTPDWWVYGRDSGAFGDAPAYLSYAEQEHAFAVESSENIVFDNIEVDGVFGDGIYVGGNYEEPSKNILVKGGHITRVGRQGLAGKNVIDITVDGLKVTKGRRAAIDWENDRHEEYIINAIVKNCHLESMQTVFAMVGRGYQENMQFINNRYKTNGATLISYDSMLKMRRKGLVFKGNERVAPWSFGSSQASIRLNMWDDVLIEDNIELISTRQSRASLDFRNSTNVKVFNNNFDGGDHIVSVNSELEVGNNSPKQKIK